MKLTKIILILLPMIFVSEAIAKTEVLPLTKKRPVIGLVLSGGGARGAAHVGVLKVLEELRIPILMHSADLNVRGRQIPTK